jgi:aminopeptidase
MTAQNPDEQRLSTHAEPLSLAQMEAMRAGARTAVRTCMGVGPADRVFILTDDTTHGIGHLLCEEASDFGGAVALHDLEQYGQRPIAALPEQLRAELLSFRPTVTFYAASAQASELTFRTGLRVFLLNDLNVRHAHMVGINSQLMLQGMRADYARVASVTRSVYDIARLAGAIRMTTPDGTDLNVELDAALRWVPCTGVYHRQGTWGNLPEGETFTCPRSVNGTLVAHMVGDHFGSRYGVLSQALVLTIEESRVTGVSSQNTALAQELAAYLDSVENGRRVGEFGIGTNTGLTGLSGNILQDEKLPGAHLAFGDPYPHETGAQWASPIHVDAIPLRCTLDVDGEKIMQDGSFDYDSLGLPVPRSTGKTSSQSRVRI